MNPEYFLQRRSISSEHKLLSAWLHVQPIGKVSTQFEELCQVFALQIAWRDKSGSSSANAEAVCRADLDPGVSAAIERQVG